MKTEKPEDETVGVPDEEMPELTDDDWARAKPNPFADRLRDVCLVPLDPDVAVVFHDSETVNAVLRALIETMPTRARQDQAK